MKGKTFRIAVVLAILVAVMSLAALPGAAQFELPTASTIDSADLYINATDSASPIEVRAHGVYYPWDEGTVTWNSLYGNPAPQYGPEVSSLMPSTGWMAFDVKSLVEAWAGGASNYGVLLEQGPVGLTRFHSSESYTPAMRPYLNLCYTAPLSPQTCIMVPVTADTLISQLFPDGTFGAAPVFYTGQVELLEKQSLVWFEVPSIPHGAGCTPGYWKQDQHLDSWAATGYSSNDTFLDVFGMDLGYATLWDAVRAKGGGNAVLARHGTAALLSAAHPLVEYPITVEQVITLVNAGDAETLAMYNELGCTLD